MLTVTKHNRRTELRANTSYPVWIRDRYNTFREATLLNISQGGAQLSWNGGSLSGEVHLVLRAKPGLFLTFNSSKAWQDGTRVGLRFSDPSARNLNWVGHEVATHLASFRVNRRCTVALARLSRERTVPMGTSRISATSLYGSSSTSQRSRTERYSSLRASSAF